MSCCNKCKILRILSIINLIFLIISLILIFINLENNNQNSKSILVSIAETGDNTQIGNATINFNENQIIKGNSLSHEAGDSKIEINKSGIYEISYQLEGTDTGSSTRFNFNAVLLVNNNPIENTLNEGAVLNTNIVNNRYTLTSTVILKLNEGDILQLGALSLEEVTYKNARIDIHEIK